MYCFVYITYGVTNKLGHSECVVKKKESAHNGDFRV